MDFCFYCTKWVVIGVEVKEKVAVVCSVDEDELQVAKISEIYVINGSTVVFRAEYFTAQFKSHFRAYSLHPVHKEAFIHFDKLALHIPQHIRSSRVLPDHPHLL